MLERRNGKIGKASCLLCYKNLHTYSDSGEKKNFKKPARYKKNESERCMQTNILKNKFTN